MSLDYWTPESMRTVKPELAFGDAYICFNKGEIYLLSFFRMSDEDCEIEEEKNSIEAFMSLQHSNLARPMAVDISGRTCKIASEYHDLNLVAFLPEVKTSMVKKMLFQIISGVHEYHLQGLVHKDLRPPNILVYADGSIKISNYKLAFVSGCVKGNKETKGCYRAPEILYSYPDCDRLPAIDMWSIGCIFAELLLGKPLFTGLSIIEQVNSIHGLLGSPGENLIADSAVRNFLQSFPTEAPKDLSTIFPDLEADGVDLLSNLLRLDRKERLGAAEALQHPYFADVLSRSTNAY